LSDASSAAGRTFDQVCQEVLADDSAKPIK
jgi:hypothetical protein